MSVTTRSSASPSVEEFEEYIYDRQAPRVYAQICVPDKTAYFDTMTVDVTDLPENISFQALRELFQDADAYKAGEGFTNPYRSDSPNREYQTYRLWRNPVNPTDYPQYRIAAREVTNVKGVMSVGGVTGGDMEDSTEKNQPVFSGYIGERPEDVIAVSVALPNDKHGEYREFWFKLPKEIRKDKYTDWMSPVSEEGKIEQSAKFKTWWLLAHGKDMPIYEVKENAPKVRYIFMTQEAYAKYSEFSMRAINAAKLQFMKDNPSDNEYHHYVPAKRESIPPC